MCSLTQIPLSTTFLLTLDRRSLPDREDSFYQTHHHSFLCTLSETYCYPSIHLSTHPSFISNRWNVSPSTCAWDQGYHLCQPPLHSKKSDKLCQISHFSTSHLYWFFTSTFKHKPSCKFCEKTDSSSTLYHTVSASLSLCSPSEIIFPCLFTSTLLMKSSNTSLSSFPYPTTFSLK